MPYDISVVIALVFIIWSVREDVKAFRIPNYLIIAGLIVGTGLLVIRGLAGDNIRDYILGTLAGLAGMMLLRLWSIGYSNRNDASLYNQGCWCGGCEAFCSAWTADGVRIRGTAYGCVIYHRAFYRSY